MIRPIAAFLALTVPGLADETPWPPELDAVIAEASSYCADGFFVAAETVVQRDLNGDGTQDWILDSAGFSCPSAYGLYCGTHGCGVETMIDGVQGSLLLRSWDVVTEDGVTYLTAPDDQGQTVRFLWTGTEWELQ